MDTTSPAGSFGPSRGTSPATTLHCDVLIVGAGASGTMLAAQLARLAPPLRVLVLDGDQSGGRGVAYRTGCDEHLLNVPARGMSAFAGEPAHFHQWLSQRMPGVSDGTFASRSLYGDYLHDVLTQACASGHVQTRADRALAAEMVSYQSGQERWRVRLRSGVRVMTPRVVLAWGNFTPAPPAGCSALTVPHFINDPWRSDLAQGLTDGIERLQPVLLLGTGLTMYDVALALRQRGHRGPLHALSRHGRVPQAHAACTARELSAPPPLGSPRAVLRWLREEVARAELGGGNWRAVIDALRPHNQRLWQSWSVEQRTAFMRHLRSLWDVHRHRAAPEIAQRIEALVRSSKLTLHSGRLVSIQPPRGTTSSQLPLRAIWRSVGDRQTHQSFARVINCTGLSSDYRQLDHELISQLRHAEWLTPDELGLGIETDGHGQLSRCDGQASPGLYTLGPPRRAQLWESIAVPELRVQAAELAQHLVSEAALKQTAGSTAING